ncbi:MAG: hypothetical protein ACREIT_12490 [Tepidisphaeraceae bacterium]
MPTKTLATTSVVEVNPRRALEDLLARSPVRDRASVEKHLAACDAERDRGHAQLWRRLAGKLAALAPMPLRVAGPHSVLFFVADGKYRKQVFALDDRNDGVVSLFLPDVMTQALRERIVSKTGDNYVSGGSRGAGLPIHAIDAANTTDPPPHVKHMIGWNRRAVCLTLATTDSDGAHVATAEALCALAARQWASVSGA